MKRFYTMKRLLAILLLSCTAVLAQGDGEAIIITIPIQSFDLANGESKVIDTGVSPVYLQQKLQGLNPGYSKDGIYQLDFAVQNYFAKYPGWVYVEIDFGSQELCEFSGWGTQVFNQLPLRCGGPGYIVVDQALPSGGQVQGANNIILHFTVSAIPAGVVWPIRFRSITLKFMPVTLVGN